MFIHPEAVLLRCEAGRERSQKRSSHFNHPSSIIGKCSVLDQTRPRRHSMANMPRRAVCASQPHPSCLYKPCLLYAKPQAAFLSHHHHPPSFGSLSPLSLSEQRAAVSYIVLVCVHLSLHHVHLDIHPSMVRFSDACSTVHRPPRLSAISRHVLLPSPTQASPIQK